MKVLAVVPDGNVLDRVRWLAKCNPDIEWEVIGVAPDSVLEPTEWAANSVFLNCDWREVKNCPQEDDFSDHPTVQYEKACCGLRSLLLGNWFHYRVDEMMKGVGRLAAELAGRECDVLLTWGERGWYNEVCGAWAGDMGLPWCRLERATFPGMFVADGSGLEQGRCDLDTWHSFYIRTINEQKTWLESISHSRPVISPWKHGLSHWLTVAPWQTIESQPRTTLGMASQDLDDRPSVFVPLQVPVDTNMVFRAGDVSDNFDLLKYVAAHYPDHNILVKKHPGDGFTSDEALASYCHNMNMRLVTGATHSYLQVVDKVASINSQVIIEAWMHGTEVEILGEPAFDLPDEPDKQALLYTLRFAYYIEPWQLTERLTWIINSNV